MSHTSRTQIPERAGLKLVGRLAVTVEEGAQMLGVGRATLYKLVMRGEIASFTVGRARRIAISTLEQYTDTRLSA